MRPEALALSVEIAERQDAVAQERLGSGLLHYFKHPEMDILEAQTVIGAVGIGVELAAKAYINRHGLLFTLQNPDDRTRIVFASCDERLFVRHFPAVKEQVLQNGVEMIDFTRTIALLDAFGVHLDKDVKGKLELLRKARNEALHGYLSLHYLQTMSKIIYGALKVTIAIDEKMQRKSLFSSELTGKFLKDFEADPANTIFERISIARQRVQKGELKETEITLSKDDELIVLCPVCRQEALATGHFFVKEVEENYGYVEEHVFFQPRTMHCPHCGLELHDEDEFYVAEGPKHVHISAGTEIPPLSERKPPNYAWRSRTVHYPGYY